MSSVMAEKKAMSPAEREADVKRLVAIVEDEGRPLDMRSMSLCRILDHRRDELLAGIDPRIDRVQLMERTKLLIREQAEKICGCTPSSIIRSVKSAMLSGLVIDKFKGEVDFIPRRRKISKKGQPDAWVTELSADPNYRGLIHFVANTNTLAKQPFCECVYEGEAIAFEGDADCLRVVHKLDPLNEHRRKQDWSKVQGLYVRWYFKDGRTVDHFLSREQIEEHRNKYSRQYQDAEKSWGGKAPSRNSTWHKEPIKMALKTVIRDAVNRDKVPISREDRGYMLQAERVERAEWQDSEVLDAEFTEGASVDVEAEIVEPHTESTSIPATSDPWGEYKTALSRAETVKDVGAVYDAFFGPESSIAWTEEQVQASVPLFQSRKEEVRSK